MIVAFLSGEATALRHSKGVRLFETIMMYFQSH
jgi:hypothetical protein